jgi:hypothetical protein
VQRACRLLASLVLAVAAGVWLESSPLAIPRAATEPFRELDAQAGLAFVHDNGARGQLYLPEIMGSGVALFDYDGDGDLDVYLVQGKPLEAGAAANAKGTNSSTSRLFRNDLTRDAAGKPVLHFTDVTEAAGVGFSGVGMGAAVADYDNDGHLDLLVTGYGSTALYRNNGNGTFTDVTRQAGVENGRWSTSAAFIDYDRDGDLDLFVANYVDFTVAAGKSCTDPVGAPDYCAPSAYHPVPARFFRNEGNGTFTEATESAGISRAYGAGLGVSVGDYNGDGWLDLYVANDATPNQLWINTHNGTFEDQGWVSGAAANAAGRPEGSMGIASGDYDGDGDEDLFVTNLTRETFVLYVNDGHGNFEDQRARTGVSQTTASMTGFGTAWLDYDRDGWLDLITANGAVNVAAGLRGSPAPYAQRNQLFHNEGKGHLVDVTGSSGAAFDKALVGRGLAIGDLDNDGDIDVVISANNGPARILLNESSAGHWVGVRLTADAGNRFGFGARIGIVRQGQPTLWKRVGTDGSYLSASDSRALFGLGTLPRIDRIITEWPDGAKEFWTGIQADREVALRRGSGTAEHAQ